MKRIMAVVHGRVQGVFFRAYTHEEASRLGLKGWVRNRSDGSVEVLLEGESATVDQMIIWLHRGSPLSLVSGVSVTEEQPIGENGTFSIRYY
ncbi:MAG: acylphosphatase [Deltaproteobacteria bacterium RIFOXYD12_FULL_50_9]|nr:MAG: acylphosphatase [Deltaproteobacteria bacterium RIFOXYD12_FULL_50_9]